MPDLKPCPFCGSQANPEVHHAFHPMRHADGTVEEARFVECSRMFKGCMARGAHAESEAGAIAAWNRRAE